MDLGFMKGFLTFYGLLRIFTDFGFMNRFFTFYGFLRILDLSLLYILRILRSLDL